MLVMGNGHAPGTATGLSIAGAEGAVTSFRVPRRGTAGLAVFFFAAFLTAGFLAGFFLPADFRAAGFLAALPALSCAFFFVAFFFTAFFTVLFALAMTPSIYMYDSGQ